MCVCKSHLHSRWATKALVANAKEQDIDLGEIVDYVSFHEYLIADWPKDGHAYISWKCTPSKDQVCEHVLAKWNQRQNLVADNNTEITVKMQQFKYEIYKTKKGEEARRLKAVSTELNMEGILAFIDESLCNFIHSRNQLKHFRSVIHSLQ